jgi:hypothetical protein
MEKFYGDPLVEIWFCERNSDREDPCPNSETLFPAQLKNRSDGGEVEWTNDHSNVINSKTGRPCRSFEWPKCPDCGGLLTYDEEG